MRKILCFALVTVILLFSLTGCLKDDYEALLVEIEDAQDELDDLKDEIDDVEEVIISTNEQLAQASQENEDLFTESANLLNEKQELEEKIEIQSYHGMEITKFQFENAFYSLIASDEYFADLYMSYLPYHYVDDYGRVLTYYLYFSEGYSYGFYWDVVLCDDNEHIDYIVYYCEDYVFDNYPVEMARYVYALIVCVVLATEDQYSDFDSAYEAVDNMENGEAFYESLTSELDYLNDFYVLTVYNSN